jgi:hypothetical protein
VLVFEALEAGCLSVFEALVVLQREINSHLFYVQFRDDLNVYNVPPNVD